MHLPKILYGFHQQASLGESVYLAVIFQKEYMISRSELTKLLKDFFWGGGDFNYVIKYILT